MASVRLPAELDPLLRYCRSSPDTDAPKIFNTYAELVVFCAAYGFKMLGAHEPDVPKLWLNQVSAIDIQTFRNIGLYPNLLLLALAATRSHDIAHEELRVIRIVEGFAAVGGGELGNKADAMACNMFVFDTARQLIAMHRESIHCI